MSAIDAAALELYNAGVRRARDDNARRCARVHAAALREQLQRRAEADVAAAGGAFTWVDLRVAHAAYERARKRGEPIAPELLAGQREYNRVMHRLKRQERKALRDKRIAA